MNNNSKNALTISVVIPAYNVGQHVGRAIGSVLAQTCPADEVIVVDDGSSDNTVDAVRSFGDRVILIQQKNAGASAARNARAPLQPARCPVSHRSKPIRIVK